VSEATANRASACQAASLDARGAIHPTWCPASLPWPLGAPWRHRGDGRGRGPASPRQKARHCHAGQPRGTRTMLRRPLPRRLPLASYSWRPRCSASRGGAFARWRGVPDAVGVSYGISCARGPRRQFRWLSRSASRRRPSRQASQSRRRRGSAAPQSGQGRCAVLGIAW